MKIKTIFLGFITVVLILVLCAIFRSPAITKGEAIQLIVGAGGPDKVHQEAQDIFKQYPTQAWLKIAPGGLTNSPALRVLAEASEDGRITLCRYAGATNLSVFFGKYPNSRYLYLPQTPEHSRRTYASSEIEILPNCFLAK